MKVLVYEHVSGGGYAEQPIPPDVLAEGFGMLRCFAADLTASGHEVTLLLDARIAMLHPPIQAFCILPIRQGGGSEKFLSSIAKISDATYFIAPETSQTLQKLVKIAEKSGKNSLNCSSSAIGKTADKAILYEKLENYGFQTPQTVILNRTDSLKQIKGAFKRELHYPVVVKPVDGVGCSGLSLVLDESQIEQAISKVKKQSTNEHFIAQEYVQGESTSVSILSNGKKAQALSLNKQNVSLAEPNAVSRYDGGCVPYEHKLKQEAFALSTKVVESIRGLRGYVGVDLVFGENEIFVVDVNPRLTTSYVGLREVAGFNVADALVNAVVNGKLPSKKENIGFACFSKIESRISTIEAYQKAAILETVSSPPFPLTGKIKTCALVLAKGESLKNVSLRLEEAKKNLLNITS